MGKNCDYDYDVIIEEKLRSCQLFIIDFKTKSSLLDLS